MSNTTNPGNSVDSEVLTCLYEGQQPLVDIVAVENLTEKPLHSWTHQENERNWLSDSKCLPRVIPDARILSFGYNVDVVEFNIRSLGKSLLKKLHEQRGSETVQY